MHAPSTTAADRPRSAEDCRRFDALCRETSGWLTAHLRRRTGSHEDAQDLCQEALTRAWRSWDEVSSAASASAWLVTVAERLVIDGWRREAYASRRRPLVATPPPEPDPDESLVLRSALRALGPDVRAAVVLHYLADWPIDRIARASGVTPSNVKSRLHRGRAVLAGELGGPPGRRAMGCR